MPTLAELKVKMDEAIREFKDKGDMSLIQSVSVAIKQLEADEAKVIVAKQQAEDVALAGKREALGVEVFEAITKLGLDAKLVALKVRGFNYYVKTVYPVAGQPDVTQSTSCGLILNPAPKARKAGNGGSTGKSKDEYGMSLSEIVAKFATPEELAAITSAESNSKSWQLKVAVKKQAIANGKLAPVK